MQDNTTKLCRKLIGEDEAAEVASLAAELRREIQRCVARVQVKAMQMVLRCGSNNLRPNNFPFNES